MEVSALCKPQQASSGMCQGRSVLRIATWKLAGDSSSCGSAVPLGCAYVYHVLSLLGLSRYLFSTLM